MMSWPANLNKLFRIEDNFKKIRIKRKQNFTSILSMIPHNCPEKNYEINVYSIILDAVIESLENIFSKKKKCT
jgi:hypothetical protein